MALTDDVEIPNLSLAELNKEFASLREEVNSLKLEVADLREKVDSRDLVDEPPPDDWPHGPGGPRPWDDEKPVDEDEEW